MFFEGAFREFSFLNHQSQLILESLNSVQGKSSHWIGCPGINEYLEN